MQQPSVARAIGTLSEEGKFDYDLLEAFKETFEGWNKAMLEKVTMDGKRTFKHFLREEGAYTGRDNRSIGRQLENLLTIEDFPEWDLFDFKKMKFYIISNVYCKQQAL